MKFLEINREDELDYSGKESLNTICSNIFFSGRNLKKIAFTSCVAGEGKSYITMNVARNLTKRDMSVVLVDCDLRRSHMIKRYGVHAEDHILGMAHYLVGQAEIHDVIYSTNVPNLYIVPQGRDISDPVPLLGSTYFSQMIDTLAEEFDVVIIDTPPVGLVVDAAEIAKSCDGVVFIIEYGKTRRSEFVQAKKQIDLVNSRILGCVINKMTFNSLTSQRYYNKYQYTHYNNEYYTRSSKSGSRKRR